MSQKHLITENFFESILEEISCATVHYQQLYPPAIGSIVTIGEAE